MRPTAVRIAAAAVVSAGGILLWANPGEAAPLRAPTKGAVLLTSFVQNGRTDVMRNEML